MMKRIFAMLLALTLVVSLLPVGVIAEEQSTAQKNTLYTEPLEQHNHTASGDAHICEHCVAAGKTGDAAVPKWQAWDSTNKKLPNTAGHWYLTGDMSINTSSDIGNAEVVICLNGYTVTSTGKRFFHLNSGAKLTVVDCTAKTVTPDPEIENDTGYRAGKLTGAKDTAAIMLPSGSNAQIYWYDGILSGNSKGTGALMSIQGTSKVYMYGGEVRDNTSTSSAIIYLGGANNAFEAENVSFIGNTSAGNGGVISNPYKGKVVATDCTFIGNSAKTGGVYYGNGGSFTATGCTFTGNSATGDYSVICGTGGGIKVTLDGCRIAENSCGGNTGAVYVPNNSTSLIVSGDTYIYGNTRKGGLPGNVYLQNEGNGNYPILTVNGLTEGARIGVHVPAARAEKTNVVSKTLGGKLTREQVISYFYSDDSTYMIDLQDDKLVLAEGHVHTAHLQSCTVDGCTGHENALYLPWTDAKSLPNSGSYYLDTDVTLDANVTMSTGTLNLCLNGHSVTFGSKRFALTGDANVNITDCSAKTENEVYTAGKLTGATNCMFQVNGDSTGKKTVVNVFEGIITGNSRPKDHASVVFIEKNSSFNLFGGEITENTVGAGSTGRGGVIYLQDNTVTFNMYGGKIYKNHAVKNGTYGGNGGAVYSRDRGIVNILGGEISGNTAANEGGAIWAKGGKVTVKNAKITGNEAKAKNGAICGSGGVQIILDNAIITDNVSASYGAIYTPNNGSKIIVSGDTKITDNKGGNVYLVKDSDTTANNHPMITLGAAGLGADARIGITMPDARLTAQPYASLTLGGKLTEYQVAQTFFCDNSDYEVILKEDRLLVQMAGSGHRHCVCGVEGCDDHAQILCKPWTATDSLPTSGSYYLENDVEMASGDPELTTGILNLCLNGKTVNFKGRSRLKISGDAVINITDCQENPGKLTGSTGSVFYMTGDNSGKLSYVNLYQGIITGNNRTSFHASVAYIQSGATLNMYGGEISGNTVGANSSNSYGGTIYLHNAKATFNMYGGKITGNTAKVVNGKGGNGAAIYSLNGGTVNLQGGEITNNVAEGYGGAIYAKGGKVIVKNTKITGNTAKQASAIYGAGGGVQITLDGATITDNKTTSAGTTYGAIYIPNNGAKIIVQGATKVENNQGGNVYLVKDSNTTNPNHPMITLGASGLSKGAHIGITMPTARLNAERHASLALSGKLTAEQVEEYFFCDMSKYSVSLKDDRLYLSRVYEDIGHKHCACTSGDIGSCDHSDVTYLAWDDPTSLPASGNYCLTVDVKTSQNVSITGSNVLNLCLNGHTIEAGGKQEGTWQDRLFDIKGQSTLNITDCTGEGKLTGGTYGVILFEDNANSKTVFNLYGGHITGNKSISIGGAVLLQGSGTFNMYGGEIHGNSMNGWVITDENGNPKLDADGNQQTSGTSNGGGAIGMNGAKTTFNMYGGKIYDNECLPTTYLKADGTEAKAGGKGGAIYSTRGTINIEGGEISGNRASQGGGIYAVIYSTINIKGGEIRENVTTGHGGGIFADNCYVTVSGGKITKNDSGEKGSGGGIQVSNGKGFLKVTGGEITGNKGYYGGGIMCQGRSPITIEGGLIAGNSADTAGGVYISTLSPAKMTGGTISGNKALNNAGGLYILRSVLNFTGGVISGNAAGREAGGLFLYGATVNMDGGVIKNNTAKNGGGISMGRLTVTGNLEEHKGMNALIDANGKLECRATINLLSGSIEGNKSTGSGGGMLIQGYGTLNIKGGEVKNNRSGGSGGGAYLSNNSTVTMEGGTFSGNHGDGTGGGMYMVNSEGTFSGGVFEKNTTKKQGGGLCTSNSKVKLSGVKIRNHWHKGVGAGYTGFNSTTTMTGGSITGNHSENYGGGMYLQRGTLNLSGGSISYNTAKKQGAGVYLAGIKTNIYYTSMVGNKCEGTGGGALFTARWNYTEKGVKKVDNTSINIKDGYFAENYGRNGGAFLVQSGATLKIEGGTYTKNEGPTAGGAIYISTNIQFEITGGTFTENRCENGDGGAINVNGAQGTIDGGENKIVFENNFAKRYGGAMNLAGDKVQATVKNVIARNNYVKNRGAGIAVNTKAHVDFENIEIYENHSEIQAGGFYVGHAPVVTMKNSKIHHNTSDAAGAGFGTECVNEVTLENVEIYENETKTKAGGVYTRAAKMHLINCSVHDNVAGGDGGGIATGSQFSRGGEIGSGGKQPGLILENTKVYNNTCVGAGGGLHENNGHQVTIINSEITGNTSGTEGSGIWTRENLKMQGLTVTGNTSKNDGYAFYIAEGGYDGQSFVQSVLEMDGDIIVKDNQGGEMYMGAVNAIAITAEGLGQNTQFQITLDTATITNRILGSYHYEGENGVYTVTYGNRSLTEPQNALEPQEEGGNALLYVGVGAVGLAVVAALVLLLLKKKKKTVGEPAESSVKE